MARPSDWDVLDLLADPTPGDPTVVSGLATQWDSVADDAEAAERGVRSLASDGAVMSWLGAAGDVFKAAIGEFPGQLATCKDSYRQGASALRRWSADLDGAQADADRALALGRQARADLESAQAALGSASSSAASAAGAASSAQQVAARYVDTPPPAGVVVPDAAAVRSSVRTAQVAQARVGDARAAVGDAQSRLDAARRMALEAKELRQARGKVAAGHIRDASQAGIRPNSFLEDLGNLAGQVWDAVITVAKVVVAVLGIVALIIGGPLAWIVFAAAVLILADTVAKALRGEATGWDIAWAALACIPGTKGLTTFKALSSAFKEGGTLAASVHILGAGKSALVEIAGAGRQLVGQGRTAVTTMASTLRSGLPGLRTTMVNLREGASSALATLKMEKQVLMHRLSGGELTPQGDMIIRRYTPAQEAGPLGKTYPADTFRSASYNEVVLRRPTTMYRSVNDFSNARGDFWSRVAPRGALHTQLDLALKPEWLITNRGDLSAVHQTLPQATSHVEATFPRGTRIFEGPTAPQFSDGISSTDGGVSIPGSVLGGGGQVVPDPGWLRRWNADLRAAEEAGIDYVDPYGLVDHRPVNR